MTLNRVVFSSARGDWETPQDVYTALNDEFDFNFDPAVPGWPETGEDAFGINWYGRIYVNPPYRESERWIVKGLKELDEGNAEAVVYLLPARTDTRLFHEYILPRASEIRFIRGRLRFKGAKWDAPFPSMVVVFR